MKIIKLLLASVLVAVLLSGCYCFPYPAAASPRSVHTYSTSAHAVSTATHYGGGYYR